MIEGCVEQASFEAGETQRTTDEWYECSENDDEQANVKNVQEKRVRKRVRL